MELPVLDTEQRVLADGRAAQHARVATACMQRQPNAAGGFVSVRDLTWTAKQVGLAPPDHKAETAMFRRAGIGRFQTMAACGAWYAMISAAEEAGRWYCEPVELQSVSRLSLRWCLAGRPHHRGLDALHHTSQRIAIDDSVRSPDLGYPDYRQLLDGWHVVLASVAGPCA